METDIKTNKPHARLEGRNRMSTLASPGNTQRPAEPEGVSAPTSPEQTQNLQILRSFIGLASIVALVLLWWAVAVLGNYGAYILPAPSQVGERIWNMLLDGSLPRHAWYTLREAGLGFLLAFVLGTALGYVVGHSHLLGKLLSPYIAVSQGLPAVALAPLLAIWVRDDLLSKVVVVVLIAFFPIMVSTMVAVRSIDRSMVEIARISGANRLQTIYYVELPLGLRALLGGIRLGLMLAIIGAVIGEFTMGAVAGLGFLVTLGRGIFDTTLIFVGLVALATLTLLVYTAVTFLERAIITWE
jgi:NitT/TauT family transport system permease protein